MNADALTPSKYIKAADFGATMPKFPTLTIRSAVIEKVPSLKPGAREGDEEKKGAIYFTDEPDDRGWVINKTNKECLKALFGNETDDWIGKRVTLMAMSVQVGPKKDMGVRIKGSPDITEEIRCVVKLPKRKPETFVLVPTGSITGAGRDLSKPREEPPEILARLTELRTHASASGIDPDLYVRFFGDFARDVKIPVGELIKATSPGGVEFETMTKWVGEQS